METNLKKLEEKVASNLKKGIKCKIRKCTKCHRWFITEVDHRNFAINTRCNVCKNTSSKFSQGNGIKSCHLVY